MSWPPVPLLWPGETVVIAASGPSLTASQLEHVRGGQKRGLCRLIVINNTWRLAPWADLLYAADARWWEEERKWSAAAPDRPQIEKFAGIKVAVAEAEKISLPGVHRMPGLDSKAGISLDPNRLHWGRNSGFQGLGLSAFLAGPGRRILIGFDFRPGPGGRLHHHADHPTPLNNPDPDSLTSWARLFEPTVPQFKELGIEVINCSPGSALTCFPMARLEDVL